MGERGQVKIGKVFLYTHWGGHKLKKIVKSALSKRWRWNDEEYLTRIIFDEMIKDEIGTETGYGIGTTKHTDLNYPLLEVDVIGQVVREEKKKWPFEEFIKIEVE